MKRCLALLLLCTSCSAFAVAAQSQAHLTYVKATHHHRDKRVQRHRAHKAGKHHTPKRPHHHAA
jgi:Ni/Co efflux regulator RcnB